MTFGISRARGGRRAAAASLSTISRTLRSGTTEYIAAEGINRCCRFVLLLVIAHHVGAAGFGDWVIAVALGTVLSNVGDLGLATEITRELSARPARLRAFLQNMWIAVLAAGGVSTLALGAVALVLSSGDARTILLCAGTGGILESAALLLLAPLRATHRLRPEAAMRALQGVILLAGGLVWLGTSGSATHVALLFPAVGAASALFAAGILARNFGVARPRADWAWLRTLLARGFPVLGTTVLFFVYFRIDSFMIERISGDRALGIYGAAFNFVFGFAFVPLMFGRTMMARYSAAADANDLRSLYRKSIVVVLAFGTAISLVLLALTPAFERLYGSSFAGARQPYLLLIAAQMLYLATNMHVQFLFGRATAHIALGLTAAALALNVGINLVLIPAFGPTGAAMTMIVCESTLLVAMVVQARRMLLLAGAARGESAPIEALPLRRAA